MILQVWVKIVWMFTGERSSYRKHCMWEGFCNHEGPYTYEGSPENHAFQAYPFSKHPKEDVFKLRTPQTEFISHWISTIFQVVQFRWSIFSDTAICRNINNAPKNSGFGSSTKREGRLWSVDPGCWNTSLVQVNKIPSYTEIIANLYRNPFKIAKRHSGMVQFWVLNIEMFVLSNFEITDLSEKIVIFKDICRECPISVCKEQIWKDMTF